MRGTIAISGALLAGACANLVEYYYMSFVDVPGIKILEYGEAELDFLFGHEEMPIRYELKRDEYTLLLSVSVGKRSHENKRVMLKTGNPKLHVRVISTAEEHDTPDSCGVFGFFGHPRTIDELRESKALHFWGKATAYCGKRESGGRILLDKMPGVLDYQILNDDGDIVAEERLHFTLVWNGTYLGADAF